MAHRKHPRDVVPVGALARRARHLVVMGGSVLNCSADNVRFRLLGERVKVSLHHQSSFPYRHLPRFLVKSYRAGVLAEAARALWR